MKKLSLREETIGDLLSSSITLVAIGSLIMSICEENVLNIFFIKVAGESIIHLAPMFFALGIARCFSKNNNDVFGVILIGISVFESVIFYGEKFFVEENRMILLPLPYAFGGRVIRAVMIVFIVIYIYRRIGDHEDIEVLKIFPNEIFASIFIIILSVFIGWLFNFIQSTIINFREVEIFKEFLSGEKSNNIMKYLISRVSAFTDIQLMQRSELEALIPCEYIFSMFTIPSLLLAIYKSNDYSVKRRIIGMFMISGVATCVTGIKFHIEIFLLLTAPILLIFNFLWEICIQVVVGFFNIDIQYGFSTGLIDYIYNLKNEGDGIFLIPIGIGFAVSYFYLVKGIIKKKNIKIFYDNSFEDSKWDINVSQEAQRKVFMEVVSPMKGELLELEDIPDKEFSEKLRGEGFAILPELGEVYAPVSGKVEHIDRYKKSISITTEMGIKVLINVGIGNVYTEDVWAKVYVENHETVKRGKKLMSIDISELKKSTASIITAIVFTNVPRGKRVVVHPGKNIEVGEKNIISIEEDL